MTNKKINENAITNPEMKPGLGTTGWWLYKTTDGIFHAVPMKSAKLKGPWRSGMTWTYDPNDVREWLNMK